MSDMDWMKRGAPVLVMMPVTRLDDAEAWYGRNLGFTTILKSVRPSFCEMELPQSGLRIGLTELEDFKLGQSNIVLEVNDIDAACSSLSAKGVEVGEIAEIAGQARITTFEDPDGNPWMLRQPI